MKKSIIILSSILLSVLMCLVSVNALTLNMKDSYQPAETAIAEITGNILEPIMKEQVEFKRNNVRMPWPYDIKKLGDNYYLWAIMPSDTATINYTLYINDVTTTVNGAVKKIDIVKNFSVAGNKSDFTINPGFIFTKSDFEINAELHRDVSMEIETDFPEVRKILLQPGQNNIKFSVKNVAGTEIAFIKLGSYVVPAYIVGSGTVQKPVALYPLQFRPSVIEEIIFIEDTGRVYPAGIVNLGSKKIENIYFQYDEDVFLVNPNKNIALEPNQTLFVNISLKQKANVSDIIYAKADNYTAELPVIVRFTDNRSEAVKPESNESRKPYYCSELSGNICSSGESCSGDSVDALDGACCLRSCSVKKDRSKGWIGWLLATLALVILGYAYFKYKKAKPRSDMINKKFEDAEKSLNKIP